MLTGLVAWIVMPLLAARLFPAAAQGESIPPEAQFSMSKTARYRQAGNQPPELRDYSIHLGASIDPAEKVYGFGLRAQGGSNLFEDGEFGIGFGGVVFQEVIPDKATLQQRFPAGSYVWTIDWDNEPDQWWEDPPPDEESVVQWPDFEAQIPRFVNAASLLAIATNQPIPIEVFIEGKAPSATESRITLEFSNDQPFSSPFFLQLIGSLNFEGNVIRFNVEPLPSFAVREIQSGETYFCRFGIGPRTERFQTRQGTRVAMDRMNETAIPIGLQTAKPPTPEPQITAVPSQAGVLLSVRVSVSPGSTVRLEGSDSINALKPLQTKTATEAIVEFEVPTTPEQSTQFFRVVVE